MRKDCQGLPANPAARSRRTVAAAAHSRIRLAVIKWNARGSWRVLAKELLRAVLRFPLSRPDGEFGMLSSVRGLTDLSYDEVN